MTPEAPTPAPVTFRVSVLTPAGTGAIAVVGLVGDGVRAALSKLVRRADGSALPASPVAPRSWFARFVGDNAGDVGDEIVLALKATSPVWVAEVHCHGGARMVAWIVRQLWRAGGEVIDWPTYLRETLPDALDPRAAEPLSRATTLRTAGILLDQYNGAFRTAIRRLDSRLRENLLAEAGVILERLHRLTAVGRHLTAPFRVAIAGAPNAGKSSLLNALAGYQRAIVAPVPGTTRDIVSVSAALEGWPMELSDTAGLRAGGDALEVAGMGLTRELLAECDLCVWVIDSTDTPVGPNAATLEGVDLPAERILSLLNKCDLKQTWDGRYSNASLRISTTTGVGLPEMVAEMVSMLIPLTPQPGEAVPFTAELCDAVERAALALRVGGPLAALAILAEIE